MMATLREINVRIAKAGFPEVEMERGEGYIYFIFDDRGSNYETETVPVPWINIYAASEWIEMAVDFGKRMRQKAADRKENGSGFRGGPFASFAGPRTYEG
jgi:hypothetical protein